MKILPDFSCLLANKVQNFTKLGTYVLATKTKTGLQYKRPAVVAPRKNMFKCEKTIMTQITVFLVTLACSCLVSGQGWTQIPQGLSYVSGNLNYIWGVNKNSEIFMCKRPCTGAWKKMDGHLVQLDVDDAEVWGVNKQQIIFVRPVDGSGKWKQIKGKLVHVSASGSGYVWGTTRRNHIMKCKKPCTGHWMKVDGGLTQIDAGQREVCGVNRNSQLFCRPVDGSGRWRYISRGFKHVTASAPYEIFAVSKKDEIFRCRKPCIGQWIQVGHDKITRLKQCDATANALFGVDAGESIWRMDFPFA